MSLNRTWKIGLGGLLLCGLAAGQTTPAIDTILDGLARSQEQAVKDRERVIYRQKLHSRLARGNGKTAREEHREYLVTPTAKGTTKELVHFQGSYQKGSRLLSYDKPDFRYKSMDLDGDLIHSLTSDLVDNKETKDGLSQDLFPLTRERQRHFNFKILGTQKVGAVDALRISFEPKKDDDEGEAWSGEVLVDPVEYQPVRVFTRLATQIPLAVKIIFGINIRQMGFQVTYRKVADGLWFPATYGTEFGIRVLFGYSRTITMDLENTDFRLTDVQSDIKFESADAAASEPPSQVQPPQPR